jgi:hypothetical protein
MPTFNVGVVVYGEESDDEDGARGAAKKKELFNAPCHL